MDPATSLDGSRSTSTQRRILCAQPVREHHRVLQHALAPHQLQITHTGLDAVRAHNAGAFDAYILDYWLPDWSGLSLCRQIRKEDRHAPVLFFSSAEGDEQRKRAMRAGADAYLLASGGAEALERAAKSRAQKAFMEAGGTLGHFSRWWLERGAVMQGLKP